MGGAKQFRRHQVMRTVTVEPLYLSALHPLGCSQVG